MILADTSIWIDHIRSTHPTMKDLLLRRQVLRHLGVVGELALGSIRSRAEVLFELQKLPEATVAEPREVLIFIERHKLYGSGIGYVDAQLLASVYLTSGATLWSRDRRLKAAAVRLGVDAAVEPQV